MPRDRIDVRARALICLTEEVSQTGSVRGHVIKTYRARARRYDITSNLYYLLGFRVRASRRQAVQALQLRPGDTVVEVGCGTGLNFALLEKAVGPDGQIVGVDLTDAMLAQARRRMQARSWSNVGLVHADVSEFEFPTGVTAILSTYALSLMPECAEIIARGCESLAPGGRWVVLDLKLPEKRARLAEAGSVGARAAVRRDRGAGRAPALGHHPYRNAVRPRGPVLDRAVLWLRLPRSRHGA